MKTAIPQFLTAVLIVCFVSVKNAQAVVPPPDGGYPGFNTAEGQNALMNLTTGVGNAAVGWYSLFSNTDGSFNTAVGAGTLLFNVGDQSTGEGIQNTAFGTAALLFNTTGFQNTANGTAALLSNTEGGGNTATGVNALRSNTLGNFNTATGGGALVSNTEGSANTANGVLALSSNVTGSANTAIGFASLQNNTASNNTAIGAGALDSNTDGNTNTAVGNSALSSNTVGNNNIAIGNGAGQNITQTDLNIDIGNAGSASDLGTIRIGDIQIETFIAGISGVNEGGTISAVYINTDGQLGTQPPASSRRYKKEIKPMDMVSEAILALKPVTFHYKSDASGTPQFGLIAEDVAKVNPDLVVRDNNGQIYTVRYEAVNAMLLNEFLKEHRKNEEQEATIEQLTKDLQANAAQHQKQIDALSAGLQKVSAQLEVSKTAPKVVTNER